MTFITHLGFATILIALVGTSASAADCSYYGYVKVTTEGTKVLVGGLKNLEEFPQCDKLLVVDDAAQKAAKLARPSGGAVCFTLTRAKILVAPIKCGENEDPDGGI